MRIIDADKLYPDCLTKEGTLALSQSQIANAPTVDTTCPNCDSGYAQGYSDGYLKGKEERPTGHWIKVTDCYCWHWECENCHSRPSRTSTGHDDLSNFCPSCGADMRKGAENDAS